MAVPLIKHQARLREERSRETQLSSAQRWLPDCLSVWLPDCLSVCLSVCPRSPENWAVGRGASVFFRVTFTPLWVGSGGLRSGLRFGSWWTWRGTLATGVTFYKNVVPAGGTAWNGTASHHTNRWWVYKGNHLSLSREHYTETGWSWPVSGG